MWFIFSGMGSQWAGMIEGLLQLEPFAKAINNAAVVLKREGIDLLSILSSKSESTFENVLNSAISITSMQVIYLVFKCSRIILKKLFKRVRLR